MLQFVFTEEVTIFPIIPVVKIPSVSIRLTTRVPLVCGLEPTSLVQDNYTSRWITPRGEIVTSSRGRFVLTEGTVTVNFTILVTGTMLDVARLSYQDAGVYTCEGRITNSDESSPWISATFELQLCCKCYNTNN